MTWREAATLDRLADKDVIGIEIEGRHLALYNLEGAYYATDDICTHAHAFLSEGYVEGDCIECPIHQALFKIATGEVLEGPAETPLRTYPVKCEGDRLLVELPD